jgi:hypothetical protein
MEKIREIEELLPIAEKYYKKLGIELSVDGQINMAEVVWVLIVVVNKSFGLIIRNHGIGYGIGLFCKFISETTKMMADEIKNNDGADRTESRADSIERGNC